MLRSTLAIIVQVQQARQAQRQLQQLGGSVAALNSPLVNATKGATSYSEALGKMSQKILASGTQMQWFGRALEYNFTLPIAAAAVASTKWALDIEQSMVKVNKVYGDMDMTPTVKQNELKALVGYFTQLSNKFGVMRSEVNEIAGDWAAAGVSGTALAKTTKLTLEAMILGQMDAAQASKALIAIQAQYKINTVELTKALYTLNAVENDTGIGLEGLIVGFSRTASIARSTGVDIRHLAAMLATLDPTTGTASQAGNGLKTILTRLVNPTNDMAAALRIMNIEMESSAWQSATMTQKLEMMAPRFKTLTASQRNTVAAMMAGAYQVNRFTALMDDMATENGYYNRALRVTADSMENLESATDEAVKKTSVYRQAQEELNAVLAASPNRLKQMMTILQNMAADMAQPLLPLLISLSATVVKVLHSFNRLSPEWQKLIGVSLLFMAALGPVIRYMGALKMAVGGLLAVFSGLAPVILKPFALLTRFLMLPMLPFAAKTNVASAALINLLRSPVTNVINNWTNAFTKGMNLMGAKALAGATVMMTPFQAVGKVMGQFLIGNLAPIKAWGAAVTGAFASAGAGAVKIWGKTGALVKSINKANILKVTADTRMGVAAWVASFVTAHPKITGAVYATGRGVSTAWKTFMKGVDFINFEVQSRTLVGWQNFSKAWTAQTAISGNRFNAIFDLAGAKLGITTGGMAATLQRLSTVHLSVAGKMSAAWHGFNLDWDAQTKFYGSSVMGFFGVVHTRLVDGARAAAGGMGAAWKGLGKVMPGSIKAAGTASIAVFRTDLGVLIGLAKGAGKSIAGSFIATGKNTVGVWKATGAALKSVHAATLGSLSAQAKAFGTIYTTISTDTGSRTFALSVAFANARLAFERSTFGKRLAMINMGNAVIFASETAAKMKILALDAKAWFTRVVIQSSAIAKMRALYAAFTAWIVAKTAGQMILTVVWSKIWQALTFVFSAGSKAVVAAYALMTKGILALTRVTFLVTMWGKVMAGMKMVTAAAWKGIVLIFSRGFKLLLASTTKFGAALLRVLIGPWGIAIAAITGIIFIFRKQIGTVFGRIGDYFRNIFSGASQGINQQAGVFARFIQFLKKAFWSLPVEVQNAMLAIVRVVGKAAQKVYELLQYINPFARHSPSLVDNVKAGVGVIDSEFSKLPGIASPIGDAYKNIASLKEITGSLAEATFAAKYAKDMEAVASSTPQAIGPFKNLVGMLPNMSRELGRLDTAVKSQEQVLKGWQVQLDAATAAVERQEAAIAKLQEEADSYSKVIEAAESRISDLAGAPLVGMREMEDQINANTQAQNRLKLEMLKIKQAGGAYADIESRISSINGELENARSKRGELQMGGAGSDVLAFYDQQIAQLEAQKKATQRSTEPLDEMQRALTELEAKAELLDLEKAVKFDGLVYEIEKLADSSKELTFEEITSGIRSAQAEVAVYQPLLDGVNQKIAEQENVLKGLQSQKDIIQAQYDAEDAKLQEVKGRYDELSESISDVEEALSSMGSAAGDVATLAGAGVDGALDVAKAAKINAAGGAGGSLTDAEMKLAAAAGGDFDLPGGSGLLGREGGAMDQSAEIDAMTADLAAETGAMLDSFDMFGPIKRKWDEFKIWMQNNINPAFKPIGDGISNAFSGVDFSAPFKEGGALGGFTDYIKETWEKLEPILVKGGEMLVTLFGDDFKQIFEEAKQGAIEFWTNVQPAVEHLKNMLPGVGVVIGIVVGILVVLFKLAINIIKNVLRPLMAFLGDAIAAIVKFLSGIFMVIEGIFTLNGSKIKEGFMAIFGSIWDLLRSAFGNALAIIWGVVEAVLDTVFSLINTFFGTEIPAVGEMITSIVDWFKRLPGMIGDALQWLWDKVVGFFLWLWDELTIHSIIPDMLQSIVDWWATLPQRTIDAIIGLWLMIQDWWNGITQRFWDAIAVVAALWNNFWSGVAAWAGQTMNDIIAFVATWVARKIAMWAGLISWVVTNWNAFWTGVFNFAVQIGTGIWNWIRTWFDNLHTNWNNFMTLVRSAWDTFWGNLRETGSTVMTAIQNGIDTALGAIRRLFDSAVGGIRDIWDGLRKAAGDPVKFVIDTVLNKGLIAGWNWIVDKLELDKKWEIGFIGMPSELSRLASGGSVPTVTPAGGVINHPWSATNRDPVLALNRRNVPIARLEGGEDVTNRASTRAMNRNYPGYLAHINKYGMPPGFWMGGTLPTTPGRISPHGLPYYGASWAGDLARPMGTPVYAWNPGTIASTARWGHSYGWHIRMNHPGGRSSLYAHLSRIAVAAGQSVAAGQLIGNVGSTGNSTGPHVHFEIRGGSAPLAGDDGSTGGGIMQAALDWITERITKPVRDTLARVPGVASFGAAVQSVGGNLLDAVVEKVKSLMPLGNDDSMSGAAAGGSWQGNANMLMQAGKALGMNRRAMKIALMTASQESSMGTNRSAMFRINGDGDVGWYQQRATRGDGGLPLGSQAAINRLADPLYGTRVFYRGITLGPGTQYPGWHVPGLLNIRGWETMGLGNAAQRVQVSAFPRAYDKWEGQAENWLRNFGYARGTKSARRGWNLVGEQGPELVKFSGGETVLDSQASAGLLAQQADQAAQLLKVAVTGAFIAALARANVTQQATLAAQATVITRDAGRRIDARLRGERSDSISDGRAGGGDVYINNAEFTFPNVKDGADAEAFMRNLEEYLRRRGK